MTLFEEEFAKLNKAQQEAVETIYGPVLVLAGPGTGKTQMLALRIANILLKTDSEAQNILCLTYTDAGTVSMRTRLKRFIGNSSYKIGIYTFHALCNEIIFNNPEYFAETKELAQISDINKNKQIREIIDIAAKDTNSKLFPFSNRYMHVKEIFDKIGFLKKEGILPDEFSVKADKELSLHLGDPKINKKTGKPSTDWNDKKEQLEKAKDFALLYSLYIEKMKEKSLYDYEDMILFVLKALKENESLLAKYQEQFQFVLVDEFQDTNGSQLKLLELLSSFESNPNIFAVGDDDQALYRFQGANVENILNFSNKFPETKIITVTTNYRSSQIILDLANSLIENNTERVLRYNKSIVKNLKKGVKDIAEVPPQLLVFENSDREQEFVLNIIKNLKDSGEDLSDVAVLYKLNKYGEEYAELLIKNNIAVNLKAGRNALEEPLVDLFLKLLEVIAANKLNLDENLFLVLNSVVAGIDADDLYKISLGYSRGKKFAGAKLNLGLLEYISNSEILKELGVQKPEVFLNFANDLKTWHLESKSKNIVLLIQSVLDKSNYISNCSNGNIESINSFISFFNYVRTEANINKNLKLNNFLNDIDMMKESNISIREMELLTKEKGVMLSTVHSAKGLEFKHVFLIGLIDRDWGKIRNKKILDKPIELVYSDTAKISNEIKIEDERRILFVGITRAKTNLYLTAAKKYDYTTKDEESISRFVGEFANSTYTTIDTEKDYKFNVDFTLSKLKPLTVKKDNSAVLAAIVENYVLSPTGLNAYIKCPKAFKYEQLIRAPHGIAKPLILGSAIHFALEKWNKAKMVNASFNLTDLQSAFKARLEKEIIEITLYDDILKEGESLLKKYFEAKNLLPNNTVLKTEYNFSSKNIILHFDDDFSIPLTGKIDRIDLADKTSGTINLIDYKVSEPKSKNAIKGIGGKWENHYRQLMFYKLLIDLDSSIKIPGVLSKPTVFSVILDYIKPNTSKKFKAMEFVIEDSEIVEFKKLIQEVVSRIKNLEFEGSDTFPLCGKCKWCQIELAKG